MLQRQATTLNQTRTPARRAQTVPGPVVPAKGEDLAGIIARLDALETLTSAQADTIAAQAATIADHEARIEALEA